MTVDDGLSPSPDELRQLAPVLAEPDEDAPRLAFADWCERRQDPRAEFIRLQIRGAARQHRGDVAALEAQGEADRLLARYGDRWTRFMRPFARGAQFYRGFIMLVTDSAAEFLHDAEQIFALAPVQQLDVTAVDVALPRLLESPHLRNLRGLCLRGARLGDDGARRLAEAKHLSELRFLDLGNNGIGMAGVEALVQSPILKKLAIVHFDGNLVDLSPSLGIDQGVVVDWSPSAAAQALIQQHGTRTWLDYVEGDRFSVARWFR